MSKKIIFIGLAFFIFVMSPVLLVHAAEEIDAYCGVPNGVVPHGSTVALTIKFSDSDKSNDFIVQGPFKILKYVNGKAIIVDFKRANDKDDTGKENPEKPTLTFSVTLSPKHKLPAPATESVTFTYFVSHKEGERGKLFTTDREQQVDCSFTVQHEIEEATTPSGGKGGDDAQKNIVPADLDIKNIGTLPTNPFYFLKEWSRGISRVFTFGATAKADLELKITNEKAAEALKVRETKPDDVEVLTIALENYVKAAERLQTRLIKIKETSENPNVEKLLVKLNERTLQHAILFNQLAERWNTDPYVEDASVVNPEASRDNNLQGAVDTVQKKIQDIVITAGQKDKNIEQKAKAEIQRADVAIHDLESELAEFAINEPGVPNNEKTGPVRLDSTPARISTNLTIERQTPKRDFGDRMKAGLDQAGGILANGKTRLALAQSAFAEGKFGEAFGQARSAEVVARNGVRVISGVLRADTGGLEDGRKNATPQSSGMPIVPGINGTNEKIVPEAEKRVFPETNNSTACNDRDVPACPSGKDLMCRDGKWVCTGLTSGVQEEQIIPVTPTPAPESTTIAPTNQ